MPDNHEGDSITPTFEPEEERLRLAWDRHAREYLDSYLVSGEEDPRINFQSILTRALIADSVFPGRFDDLIDAEWRFGLCLTWLIRRLEHSGDGWKLFDYVENADETKCPGLLIETYHALQRADCPIPDYVSGAISGLPGNPDRSSMPVLSTFEHLWKQALPQPGGPGPSVLEVACGSANDYRVIDANGLAPFIAYTGLDISARNIANASRRFPQTTFLRASALDIPAQTAAYDYVFVHDLFEHLSPDALEKALGEILRVAKKEAWLAFFNMDEKLDHRFRESSQYHLNRLSAARVRKSCLDRAADVQIIDIPKLVREKFGYTAYHNPNARTFIVTI